MTDFGQLFNLALMEVLGTELRDFRMESTKPQPLPKNIPLHMLKPDTRSSSLEAEIKNSSPPSQKDLSIFAVTLQSCFWNTPSWGFVYI